MTILSRNTSRAFAALLLLASLVFTVAPAFAATIVIVNNDGAGEGFNDPAPRVPVGGNPGVTLGAQRLFIFQHAASIWGSILPSTVTIQVRAQFNPQTCTPTSAVLGSAGPVTVHANFANALFTNYWYHAALANKTAGTDLSIPNPDINATFNSALDGGTCLGGTTWYYGIDGNEGTLVELLPVLLHELGHGLGFSTTTSGTTGNYNTGLPSIYDKYLFDNTVGLHWDQMTPAQRIASAINTGNLVWDGPNANTAAPYLLAKRPRLLINSPGGIAGTYAAVTGTIGGALTAGGVTGNVVLMADGVAPLNDGCEALSNAAAIAGNIALVDRGLCTFVIKAQAAQAAGATALLIANNVPGAPQPPGGVDPSITIPVVGITQAEGVAIKANLGGGVNVTIGLDPLLLAGADNLGRQLIYSPNPFQSGSSVSHWDVSLTPNALMEPAINNDLHDTIDHTLYHFEDIGWFPYVTATTLAMFAAENRADGIMLRWQFSDPADVASVTVERAHAANGPWQPVSTELGTDGNATTALDVSTEPGTIYFYRLSVVDRAGATAHQGLTSGSRTAPIAGPAFLAAPTPNPTSRGASVKFRLARPEYVRLNVTDASGRTVRTLREGMMLAGEYNEMWDGQTDRQGRAPVGIYFITMHTSDGRQAQRLAVVR